jgi:hypothetical protein
MSNIAGNILNKIMNKGSSKGINTNKILGKHFDNDNDSNDSAYTRHVSIEMKKGKSMKEAARSWQANKRK